MFELFIGNIYFVTFQDVIEFCCNYSPVLFLSVFVFNCLFGIFRDMFNFGGGGVK